MTAPHHDPELITTLETERYRAMVVGDYAGFARLCHPGLRYVHSTAEIDTLDSYLAKCLSGHYDYRRIDHPIDEIAFVGDIALVFGQMRSDLVAGGVAKTLDNLCLAVWRWDEGRWRFFAYQPTAKPSSASPRPDGSTS